MKRRALSRHIFAPSNPSERTIAELFAEWQSLPAFAGVDWSRVDLVVKQRTRGLDLGPASGSADLLGRGRYRVTVRLGLDAVDARATLLHEMAHVATFREWVEHGPRWAACYAEALGDIEGIENILAVGGGAVDLDAYAAWVLRSVMR